MGQRSLGAEFFDMDSCGDCDVAWLPRSWPQQRVVQIALLLDIASTQWSPAPDFDFIHEGCYKAMGTFRLRTGFGHRWFMVWEDFLRSKVLILKQANTNVPVTIQCILHTQENRLDAIFRSFNGVQIGTQSFYAACMDKPLSTAEIIRAARDKALHQCLIETPHETICCYFPGFSSPLPPGIPLWMPGSPLSEDNVQTWLAYLRTLSPWALEALAETPRSVSGDTLNILVEEC